MYDKYSKSYIIFKTIYIYIIKYVSFENLGFMLSMRRFTLIQSTGTKHFKDSRKDDINKVELKLEELKLAMVAAASARFCQRHAEPLLAGLAAIKEKTCGVEHVASLTKELELVGAFQPCPKATMQKALGASAPVMLELLEDNKAFYDALKQALPVLIPLVKQPQDLTPGTLLSPAMVSFMEIFSKEKVLEHVRKLFHELLKDCCS